MEIGKRLTINFASKGSYISGEIGLCAYWCKIACDCKGNYLKPNTIYIHVYYSKPNTVFRTLKTTLLNKTVKQYLLSPIYDRSTKNASNFKLC